MSSAQQPASSAGTPEEIALAPESPEAIVRALNYHGAFLKKHVVKCVIKQMRCMGEEIPASFAQHIRAADIVAHDGRGLYMVFECKKVAAPKRWVFVRDMDDFYRVSRGLRFRSVLTSINANCEFPQTPVCSDFYQYDPSPITRSNQDRIMKRADPQAIYDAAMQLCGTFLGFVQQRLKEVDVKTSPRNEVKETYVPVLVTNAPLSYLNVNSVDLDTRTGNLKSTPEIFEVPHLILNFPFASLTQEDDFRRESQGEDWKLQYQESLYVVNVNHLDQFLADAHRKILVEAESEPRNHRAARNQT